MHLPFTRFYLKRRRGSVPLERHQGSWEFYYHLSFRLALQHTNFKIPASPLTTPLTTVSIVPTLPSTLIPGNYAQPTIARA